MNIDVFKCIVCSQHKSGTEVGETCQFPYAKPPRMEVTCKSCANIDACEIAEQLNHGKNGYMTYISEDQAALGSCTDYYKADVEISTEEYELDNDGVLSGGIIPDSYQSCGIVETLKAATLEELVKLIESKYHKVADYGTVFENRIELQYDYEHDYRTPAKDQVPMVEMATFYITKVTEVEVEESELEKFIRGEQ